MTSLGRLLLSNGECMSRNVKCSCCLISLELLNDAYISALSADDSPLNLHCVASRALLICICHGCRLFLQCVDCSYKLATVSIMWKDGLCFVLVFVAGYIGDIEVGIITCRLFGYLIFFMVFQKYRTFSHWFRLTLVVCLCSLVCHFYKPRCSLQLLTVILAVLITGTLPAPYTEWEILLLCCVFAVCTPTAVWCFISLSLSGCLRPSVSSFPLNASSQK